MLFIKLFPHEVTNILHDHVESGYSVNVNGQVPTSGYMVGGLVPSLVLTAAEMNYKPFLTTDAWLESNFELLQHDSGVFAGIWKDSETGSVYVDLSENFEDINAATAIARARGELAIWDVASAQEVRLEQESYID